MIPKSFSSSLKRSALGVTLYGAASLFAHYTWLSPTPSTAKIGETVVVRLGNGHSFPVSEELVKDIELIMTVVDHSGKPTILVPTEKGKGLEASYKVETEGVYRVACEYDRGIISRTPEGWKPGGRSKYAKAMSVLKAYNSFLSVFKTSAASILSVDPIGLVFEISWRREGLKLLILATTKGNPIEGAEISAIIGSGDAKPIGKTDKAGRIEIEIPDAFKGLILLMGSISKPMPVGFDYDAERKSSSYFLNWE